MAQAPKSTKPDKPAATTKAPSSDAAGHEAKAAKGGIEDAEVIGETPPKATKPSGHASATRAKPAAAAAKSDDAPAKTGKPAPKPAPKQDPKPTTAAKPASAASAKPAVKPAEPGDGASAEAARPAAAQRRRGGFGAFIGLLLGGLAAAVIGFVAARTVVPEGWPFPGVPPEEDPLAGVVEAQGAQIATLEQRLAALDAAVAEVKSDTTALDALRDSLATRLDGLEAGANDLAAQLDTVETRLAAVEKLAPEGSAAAEAAAQAYARELADLREMFAGKLADIEAAQAEATTLEAQVAANAKAAAGRAALAQMLSALDSGQPFDAALGELTETAGIDAPAALAAVAAEGVPTLADLQASFPVAARSALEAATRAAVEDGSMSRMEAFLRSQLGTRSLEPKQGDDADAVLSRAEAALKSGDLDAALAELDALPDAARPALAEWRTQAQTRAEALAAGAALADELNAK